MSRTARAIAVSAALIFSLHMVSLHGEQKSPRPAPAPHAGKTTAKPQAPKASSTKPAAKTQAVTKQKAPKAATPKAAVAKGTTAKPATKSARNPAEKAKPVAKVAKTDKKTDAASVKKTSVKKADSPKKDVATKKAKATTKTETSTTASTTPVENLGPVQQKLAKNQSLSSKLQSRLPAGTSLMDAADGFRNLGQFVAAVNVSTNLNIPFDKLKADMVTKKMSLGQSIQDLRPATSAAVEAQRAEYDADMLIAQTERGTTVTATASASATTKTSTKTSTTAAAKPGKSNRKTLTGGE
jgi:outer membrane biosynthesis protein TonB